MCRVLFVAVVVIYLMCVFLMSGMQKEDLDVSMLTKLQRHNVNIDDLNNEELLEECIRSRSNKIEFMNVTANQTFRKSEPLIESVKENDDFNNTNVLKTQNDFSKGKASLKNAYDNKIKVKDVIQYNEGQPKLESVLKFWQDMRMNKANTESLEMSVPTRHFTKNNINKAEQQNIEGILDSSFNADAINKLFANLSKQTSTTSTTLKSIDLGDIYKKIYLLQRHDIETMSAPNPALENHYPYLSSQLNQRFTLMGKENEDKELDVKEVHRPSYIARVSNDHNLKTDIKENPYLFKNIYLQDFKKSEAIETTTNKDPKYTISRDTIKEIAESVKEIILRDLRKELRETTILTSTTITTTIASTKEIPSKAKTDTITQTTIHNDLMSQESLMFKFLQLFEEIKSLKQNSILITSENKKDLDIQKKPHKVDNNEIKTAKMFPQAIEISARNSITTKLSYSNPNVGTTQYSMLNSDIFNFSPQLHKFRSNGTLSIRKPLKTIKPITVQTNNLEIPPLRIPLSKPQSLINQNIIVTTTTPYRIVPNIKGENQRGSQYVNFHPNKRDKAYKSKQSLARLSKERYEQSVNRMHSNNKDDIIRFTLNNTGHSKYNSDYYEKVNLGKFISHSDSAVYEFEPKEMPSFHEKLERVERFPDFQRHNKYVSKVDCCNEKYGYSKAMADCCNRKIASRHQMSFNNMKRNSQDDTHFKNFLKSQQKVTDMLERILSDKGDVQSVETA